MYLAVTYPTGELVGDVGKSWPRARISGGKTLSSAAVLSSDSSSGLSFYNDSIHQHVASMVTHMTTQEYARLSNLLAGSTVIEKDPIWIHYDGFQLV